MVVATDLRLVQQRTFLHKRGDDLAKGGFIVTPKQPEKGSTCGRTGSQVELGEGENMHRMVLSDPAHRHPTKPLAKRHCALVDNHREPSPTAKLTGPLQLQVISQEVPEVLLDSTHGAPIAVVFDTLNDGT